MVSPDSHVLQENPYSFYVILYATELQSSGIFLPVSSNWYHATVLESKYVKFRMAEL